MSHDFNLHISPICYNYPTGVLNLFEKRRLDMYRKKLTKQIKRRKNIINFLLLFLSPTNSLMIKLSKDLDKLVLIYQKNLYRRYTRKHDEHQYIRLTA